MKIIVSIFFLCAIASSGFGQPSNREREKVLYEGMKLYRSEMASWYGTDIFLAKFKDRAARVDGYVSYVDNDKAVCIFFSKESPSRVLATIAFDKSYDVNKATVDANERDLTPLEEKLVAIRTNAFAEYNADKTLFKRYKGMNPNFIPLVDKLGSRVYILTGHSDNGVIVFGNDYFLGFDKHNKLEEKKQIHANIITIRSDSSEINKVTSTMHTHLATTGSLITPTDICTLMLYCKFMPWKQHYVISPEYVSIWSCGQGLVAVMPLEAWKRIGKDQEEKKN